MAEWTLCAYVGWQEGRTQRVSYDFCFESRNGGYICSVHRYNYWLLYRLPELPDPSNPPGNQLIAPVGVDELMVEDGEHYLYWYKKL